MQTDFERLLAIQEAQLAHARWLAGLQASPFTPPELDGDKAAVTARQLNPKELAPGMEPEDYGAADHVATRLSAAIEEIKNWSAFAFKSAAKQPKHDEFGRRFIEHGAVCYANCVFMLQRVLSDASPHPSKAPSESQLRHRQ